MMVIVLLVIFTAAGLLCCYIGVRNNMVFKFITDCSNAAFNVVYKFLDSLQNDDELKRRYKEYEQIEAMKDRIISKSYNKMLLSFKPLKLEYWFTPEEIEFIKEGGSNGNNG